MHARRTPELWRPKLIDTWPNMDWVVALTIGSYGAINSCLVTAQWTSPQAQKFRATSERVGLGSMFDVRPTVIELMVESATQVEPIPFSFGAPF